MYSCIVRLYLRCPRINESRDAGQTARGIYCNNSNSFFFLFLIRVYQLQAKIINEFVRL